MNILNHSRRRSIPEKLVVLAEAARSEADDSVVPGQSDHLYRSHRLRLEDVRLLARGIDKIQSIITALDGSPGKLAESADLRARLTPAPEQRSPF